MSDVFTAVVAAEMLSPVRILFASVDGIDLLLLLGASVSPALVFAAVTFSFFSVTDDFLVAFVVVDVFDASATVEAAETLSSARIEAVACASSADSTDDL